MVEEKNVWMRRNISGVQYCIGCMFWEMVVGFGGEAKYVFVAFAGF